MARSRLPRLSNPVAPGVAAEVIILAAHPAREAVSRLLGYGPKRRPNRRSQAAIDAWLAQADQLLVPRGSFRIISRRDAEAASMPRPSAQVAVGLCTIGPALEQESRRCARSGAVLDSLVLDAIGSAAAEAAADALSEVICRAVRPRGLAPAARISPGYGSWAIERQTELLSLLPTSCLGVTLTTGGMMVPQKSVSFAARLLRSAPKNPQTRCRRCSLQSCKYRLEVEKT